MMNFLRLLMKPVDTLPGALLVLGLLLVATAAEAKQQLRPFGFFEPSAKQLKAQVIVCNKAGKRLDKCQLIVTGDICVLNSD